MVHIIITLDIDGDLADARHAVSKALDDGELQDCVLSHAEGHMDIDAATCRVVGEV